MRRMMAVELLKLRRKMVWFLVVLGPFGVAAMQAVNFGLRYDYLTQYYAADLWSGLIGNVAGLMTPTLFVGLAIVASMTAGIEHQTNAWKQTLALPIARTHIFAGKFTLVALLMLCSCLLLALMTVALGLALGFGADVPYAKLATTFLYPFLAVMPFIALQTGLSVILHNQAAPLTIGIAGTVCSMFGFYYDDWVPWKWPSLQNAAGEPLYSAAAGLALGAVVFAAGLAVFNRKDVK